MHTPEEYKTSVFWQTVSLSLLLSFVCRPTCRIWAGSAELVSGIQRAGSHEFTDHRAKTGRSALMVECPRMHLWTQELNSVPLSKNKYIRRPSAAGVLCRHLSTPAEPVKLYRRRIDNSHQPTDEQRHVPYVGSRPSWGVFVPRSRTSG